MGSLVRWLLNEVDNRANERDRRMKMWIRRQDRRMKTIRILVYANGKSAIANNMFSAGSIVFDKNADVTKHRAVKREDVVEKMKEMFTKL
ncbi:hypothetical protein R6Q59_002970 [Mikania micrantha]